MKKLLFLSALILISCSKGDESEEVETEDNRPLIERAAFNIYTEDGGYNAPGYIFLPDLGNNRIILPIWKFQGRCDSIMRDVSTYVNFEISNYKVILNEKNNYSSTWRTGTYDYILEIYSFGNLKSLDISLKKELNGQEVKSFRWLGQFNSINRNPDCYF